MNLLVESGGCVSGTKEASGKPREESSLEGIRNNERL